MRSPMPAALLLALGAVPVAAQHESVLGTVHNLSVSGPGEIRSATETQVCKFCHVPHNAAEPQALWGRSLSQVSYRTAELERGRAGARPAPQPDGASRLCLSCHDGTVALGELSGRAPIPISKSRLSPGDRGYRGTDLSGSHPISFVVADTPLSPAGDDADIGTRSRGEIEAGRLVHLDASGKMQCTTCHDPHADRYHQPGRVPRFWVAPTLDEVCLACHVLR